jgi:sirohydrochlorin cobaltochelatase
MPHSATTRGVILFGHGSRDPTWQRPMEAVASHMQQIAPAVQVRCAYLELSAPDLPTCVAELAGRDVTSITLTPMFLGVGQHVRHDLPRLVAALRVQYPHVAFELRPAIGEEAQVIELMARIALT